MEKEEKIIEIRKLKLAFGSKLVLDEIDLDLYRGETLAVIGPSGSGKSTLLKLLTGLLQPTAGSILIGGKQVGGYSEAQWDELRRQMGVVFQYSALFDFLTVGENVAFGLRRHFKLTEAEIQQQVASLLQLVGLPHTEKLWPAELSGGMKKRVGLARALAMQPEILYYDEPTAGLDPVMTMTISRLIRKTQEQLGVSSLLVTHDMESVFVAADRIAVLYDGKIVQVGTVEAIKHSSNPVVQAFINGQELEREEEYGQ